MLQEVGNSQYSLKFTLAKLGTESVVRIINVLLLPFTVPKQALDVVEDEK